MVGFTVQDTGVKARLDAAVRDLKNKSVKVGWFETAVYPDGQQVAYVAAIQEFGSPEQNIPARPFILPTYAEKKPEWAGILKDGMEAVLDGDVGARDVLTQLGGKSSGEIAKAITAVTDPPLRPATIQARLDKAGIDKEVTENNVTRLFDANGNIDDYQVDGQSIGLLGKPLIDTGIMLASLTFEVGNATK